MTRAAAPALALLLLCAAALAGTGCHVGRAMIASDGDYADYRRIRLAQTLDERLVAAWYYVNHRRDGRFADPVQAYFARAEPVYWQVHKRSVAGLETYLSTLPDGPHAEPALAELMRLRRASRRDAARSFDSERSRARLDAEAARRREAAGLAFGWLRALVDSAAWQGPLDEAPGALLVPYRLGLPQPECERDEEARVIRCSKIVERSFDLVVDGERVEREILLWLELTLDDRWHLVKARLVGADLFVRHAEAAHRRAVPDGDGAARAAAVEQFLRRAMEVVSEPVLDCGPTEGGAGLAVRCGALVVSFRVGEDQDDDEISIEPAGRGAAEASSAAVH